MKQLTVKVAFLYLQTHRGFSVVCTIWFRLSLVFFLLLFPENFVTSMADTWQYCNDRMIKKIIAVHPVLNEK